MLGSLTTFVGSGTFLYLWLTAVTAPLVSGLRATFRAPGMGGWRSAIAAALGLTLSATMVPAALGILVAMWRPEDVLGVIQGPGLLAGATAGAMLYVVRAMALGLPRLPPRAEILLASALESWAPAERMQGFEGRYRHHVIDGPVTEPVLEPAGITAVR
jgi:hypothetical protein